MSAVTDNKNSITIFIKQHNIMRPSIHKSGKQQNYGRTCGHSSQITKIKNTI